jgi:hypothetical protein
MKRRIRRRGTDNWVRRLVEFRLSVGIGERKFRERGRNHKNSGQYQNGDSAHGEILPF